MALPQGTKIGSYEISAPLGAGGMGEVYRAHDTRLKRDVALKILPEALARDPDRMARFQREAELLAALNHPNIAHIYGVEERALVMELVEGNSPAGPLPFEEAWNIAEQVAAALEYAHEKGIIHRDLKPANVKVTPEGVVKLLDFGLAKVWRDESPTSRDSMSSETLTMGATEMGVVMGTPAYMAPEQASGKPVDRRADIWSWGVMLYELLTGRRLFRGENTTDTLRQILTMEPDLERITLRVRPLLRRCLEKQPRDRLRDIGDARLFLEESNATPVSEPAEERPSKWWPGVAAGAVALIFGIGFWRLASEPQSLDLSGYRIRPFATEEYAERNPVWSPDGKSIAYAANPRGGSELRVKSLDGSPPVILARGKASEGSMGIVQPSWAPDGSTLYYIDAVGIVFGPVFSVSRAGGEPARVLQGDIYAAAISPNGRILAVLTRDSKTGSRILSLSSPPGSSPKQIAVLPISAVQNRVAWSTDGTKILVWLQSGDPTPTSSIWLVDASSGATKLVARPADTVWLNFSWFPDLPPRSHFVA